MEQPEGEQKKLSIGEALEAMRNGKAAKTTGGSAASAAAQAASARPQRIPPGFWLQNLQDGIQRSRDQLYESISTDASALNGMRRRDLAATEMFNIPAGYLDEIKVPENGPGSQISQLTRYQDIEVIDLSAGPAQDLSVESVAAQGGTAYPDTRFHLSGVEDLSAAQAENAQPVAYENPDKRFEATEELSINLADFEEVAQDPVQEGPKKFKVNPMIREIFQKKQAEG